MTDQLTDRIAEVLAKHQVTSLGWCCCGFGFDRLLSTRQLAAHQAEVVVAAIGPNLVPTTVTRVDVVDQSGDHEFWGDRWEFHIQDDERTLKAVQRDGYGAAAKALRDVALARDLVGGASGVLGEEPQ